MKLLFDQNLSFRLCDGLADQFPGSSHVGRLGLSQAEDALVWKVAGEQGFALVSQDVDFAEMALLCGPGPKVIWLRCGNSSTAHIAGLLRERAAVIRVFLEDATAVCLEVY